MKGALSLGSRVRMFEPNIVYNTVSRTVDRTFLFAPNHRKDNPLLRHDCPADALSSSNLIIPQPSIINIVGSSIGRALKENPINIHWYEGNINHNHPAFSAIEETIGNIPGFFRHSNSLIARGINKTWEREGPVFTGRYRCDACLDDDSAEKKLLYAITNPVKDGLVSSTKQSPFFSTFKHQSQGEPLKFWWIDWAGYWKAGGSANKKHHPKEYLKWIEWEITPLPNLSSLSVHQRQTRIRKLVKEEEEHQEDVLRKARQTVIGVRSLFETDPRQRPKNPKVTGRQPLCHAKDRATRVAYEEKWRDFLNEYRRASWDFRNGNRDREFPPGSCRPPIIRIITEDGS
jgi:hypothetical protein